MSSHIGPRLTPQPFADGLTYAQQNPRVAYGEGFERVAVETQELTIAPADDGAGAGFAGYQPHLADGLTLIDMTDDSHRARAFHVDSHCATTNQHKQRV